MTVGQYNQCVDNYSDNIYRFILRNLKDEDQAKDVVQDTFMKLWERVRDVSFEKAKSYLFTTAYHTMIDYIRKNKKFMDASFPVQQSDYGVNEYFDLSEILSKAVENLPDIQRSVILLRDYEGYSYQEIGNITGLSESQVKVYIYRARMFLKDYLVSIDHLV